MVRKKTCLLISGFLLTILFLSACGTSQADLDATAKQAAADVFETQTAAATNTPIPTSTPTFTPTPTKVPSLSDQEIAYANTVINLLKTYSGEWKNVFLLLIPYSDDASLSSSKTWLDQLAAALNLIHEANQSVSQLSASSRFAEVQTLLDDVSSDSANAIIMLSGLVLDRLNQDIIFPGWTEDMIWFIDLSFFSTIYTAQENLEEITQKILLGVSTTNITNDDSTDGRARWSPDGSRIAFLSDRNGNIDIFLMGQMGKIHNN